MIAKRTKSELPKIIFFSFVVITIMAVMLNFSRIMIPFGIAYILALMLKPFQKLFFSADVKKKIIAFLLLGLFGFITSYPIIKGINTLTDESHRIEYYLPKVELYLRKKYSTFRLEIKQKFNYDITIDPIDKLLETAEESTKSIFVYLPSIVASALEWGLMIPLFLFFILKDERSLRISVLKIVPNMFVEKAYYLYYQFNTKFGDYIFAKFIEASIVGVIITTGLVIIDYPFAFLLGLVAALTNILPYIGPFLGYLPALAVGLVDQNPHTTLGAMTLLYVIANIIDLALVFPLLVSKIVNLHPIIVVVSVILGSQFGGVIGMLISIPLAAFLKLLYKEIYMELYN